VRHSALQPGFSSLSRRRFRDDSDKPFKPAGLMVSGPFFWMDRFSVAEILLNRTSWPMAATCLLKFR